MAYSDSLGRVQRESYINTAERGFDALGGTSTSGEDVAYSSSERLEMGFDKKRQIAGHGKSWEEIIGWGQPSPLRDVRGVAPRFSKKLDSYIWRERIKALGNSVVPKVAREIAKAIKHIEGIKFHK